MITLCDLCNQKSGIWPHKPVSVSPRHAGYRATVRKSRERKEWVGRWEIHIVSYRLDKVWICTVDNVSPGANIARATGKTREEAEERAMGKAKERLAQTRVQKT